MKKLILKVYIEEDKVRLVSLNDKYDDIIAPIDEVRIVGLVTKALDLLVR